MAYEDFDSGILAREMVARMSTRLGPVCTIVSDTWKFELIGNPRLQQFVAKAAGEADMIIIAAKGDAVLPTYVVSWLDCWAAGQRSDPVALVALLEPQGVDVAPAALDYLTQVAARAHADFFRRTPSPRTRFHPPS